jgi:hypothetical protein
MLLLLLLDCASGVPGDSKKSLSTFWLEFDALTFPYKNHVDLHDECLGIGERPLDANVHYLLFGLSKYLAIQFFSVNGSRLK